MSDLFGQEKQVLAPRSPNASPIRTARASFGPEESECEPYSDSRSKFWLRGVRMSDQFGQQEQALAPRSPNASPIRTAQASFGSEESE